MLSMTRSIRSLRNFRIQVSLFVLIMACLLLAQTARAQVTFSNAQRTIASGFLTFGVAVDSDGNVYLGYGTAVIKETLSGGNYIQSTRLIVGGNTNGTIAVDASGNLYVAELTAVIKETLSGGSYTPSTIGSGISIYASGVAVDGSGNVYIADYGNWRVLKETPSAGGYTQSVVPTTGLYLPWGIAVDAIGDLYICDQEENQVLKETVSAAGYTQSTVGSDLKSPGEVAMDGNGDVYVLEIGPNVALKFTPSDGGYTQSTIASNLIEPVDIAADSSGNVYLTGAGYDLVVKESISGGNFGTVNVGSKSTTPISAFFTFDSAITLGSTAVVTQGATGLDFTDAGTGTCSAGTAYTAGQTCTVDVNFAPRFPGDRYGAAELLDGSGNVLASGYMQGAGVGPQANFLPGTPSILASGFLNPSGVATDASGNIYISDSSHRRVLKETLSAGQYVQSTVAGSLNYPIELAVDGSGNVYIADEGGSLVYKETLSAGGYTQSTIGTGLANPWGVAVDGSGNVYIADGFNDRVLKETPSAGSYTQSTIFSGEYAPYGIAVDGSGNVYFAEPYANKVLKETLSAEGYTQTIIGSGLVQPQGVAVDGTGNVYVADTGNSRVVKETLSAGTYTQSTIIGKFSFPVAVDGGDNVYTTNTNTLLKQDFADPPSLSFVATPVGSTSSDSPQTVTLENIGNAPLTFPALAAGDNPGIAGDFTLNSSGDSACPLLTSTSSAATLAVGATCQLPISFQPTTPGALSGSLALTDNTLNAAAPGYATQSILLSGTGEPASTAALTSPTPGSTFTSSNVSFVWSAGTGVTAYELLVGTTGVGSSNIYSSGSTTATSAIVSNIPANGGTVYVELISSFSVAPTQSANYTFTAATPVPAALTSPSGTTLTSFATSFAWTQGTAVTYELKLGTTGAGSNNIFDSGSTTATSATVSNIPTVGATVYVQLISNFIGAPSQLANYTFTEATAAPAALTSPTGTTLSGSSVPFAWTTGSLVTEYELWVGTTGVSSSNIYNSHWTTATSATVNNIPTNGGTVFVRLYSLINGAWQSADYTFIESGGPPVAAALTSPTGTTLTGSSQTFTWSTGAGVTRYQLHVGTTSPGTYDIYDSDSTTATSASVNNIPTNGGTLYVSLCSEINGVWQYAAYTFLESGGPPVPAALTSPTGTTISSSSVSFAWTAGVGVSDYELWVGTTGPGSSNLYNSHWTSATSVTVSSIPTSGGTVFVRLYSLIDGAWQFTDYTFVESGTAAPATLTLPTGPTLSGSSVPFAWTTGTGVTRYVLEVGTAGIGSKNIYDSGSTTATSATVNNIPASGETVYVELSSEIDGVWQYVAYTFTAP
jgi:streptogramin lyase